MFAKPFKENRASLAVRVTRAFSSAWRNRLTNVNWSIELSAAVSIRYFLVSWEAAGVVDGINPRPIECLVEWEWNGLLREQGVRDADAQVSFIERIKCFLAN